MFYSGVVTEESLARAVRVCAHQKAGVGESRRNIATTRAGCSNFNRVNLGGNETNACKQPEGAEILAGVSIGWCFPAPAHSCDFMLTAKNWSRRWKEPARGAGAWHIAHDAVSC